MFTFLDILATIALVVSAGLWYAMFSEGMANWRKQAPAERGDSETAE